MKGITQHIWIPQKEDIVSFDYTGEKIELQVPAEKNRIKGTVRINIDDVIKAEQIHISKEYDIEPIEVQELLLLFVKTIFFEGGHIKQKFRFNKMLFYLWKEMEKKGYKKSFIYDEFVSARAGPIPKNLKDSMKNLEKKGVVKVVWATRPGESYKFSLTDKGNEIAKSLWEKTPDDIKNIYIEVKKDLFLVDATELKNKVHKDYPEYKKTYTELDKD